MGQLALIADDLTGAADSSACFAGAGLSTAIPFAGPPYPPADVIALTTESRDMAASAAVSAVSTAVADLCAGTAGAPRWIYKKIDSVLRGHPREELLAAMAAIGTNRAVVAPALPAEGRTTVNGRQMIGGVPLEGSPFGGPGVTSNLKEVFANDCGSPVRHLDLATLRYRPQHVTSMLGDRAAGIVVADAETDDDLRAIAQVVSQSDLRLLCGAAGFARQLAQTLPLSPAVPVPVAIARLARPILVVAGSRHATTARQIAELGSVGVSIVHLDQRHVDDPSSAIDELVDAVAAHLAAGKTTVVTTSGLAASGRGERTVAARLAEIVTVPTVRAQLGGLILTGGDVAAAVCTGLGATALWLGGEIYAGQPWGILAGGVLPGLAVATKAGSFGRDDALLICVDYLANVIKTT
jgi:uncharacterized protein YgbK (DUF1537 family)